LPGFSGMNDTITDWLEGLYGIKVDSVTAIVTLAVIGATVILFESMFSFRNHFDPKGKHCYIGGGSQGLGLSLAELLTSKGANVTIVGRSEAKLKVAVEQLEKTRQSPAQIIQSVSADLSSPSSVSQSFDQASKPFDGRAPEVVFCCAGGAGGILGYFTQLESDQLKKAADTNYFTSLWTSHEGAKRMAAQKIPGKIVLVSSVLGYFGLVGYSAYSPMKHAVRGLADALRNELLLYDISVHCYFPATIYSPGFEEEEKSKPKLTKVIEGADEGLKPEQCAKLLIRGLERGHFHITSDPIGHLFRNSMRGIAPRSTFFLDGFWSFVGGIGLPIWRVMVDGQVRKHGKQSPEEVRPSSSGPTP